MLYKSIAVKAQKRTAVTVQQSFFILLQYKADKSRTAIIYYTFKSLLKLHACIVRHFIKLAVQSLVDKLVQGLAENVRLPYLESGRRQIRSSRIHDKFLGLPLRDRRSGLPLC